MVSIITNDEPCHRDTFFSSSRARSINRAPMAAEWRIARVDSRPHFSSSFQSQTPMARRRMNGASRVSPVGPHSRHKLLVRIDSAQRQSSRFKSAKASDSQFARWMATSPLVPISCGLFNPELVALVTIYARKWSITVAPLICLWRGLTSKGLGYGRLGSETAFKGADGALLWIDRELLR